MAAVIVDHLSGSFEPRAEILSKLSLDCGSPLPLSRPQPAVDNRSKLADLQTLWLGSRLPSPKRQQAAAVQTEAAKSNLATSIRLQTILRHRINCRAAEKAEQGNE
jgi:hypothetical protein